MAVLVTGGAGYIGSVAVELLRAEGEEVVVLDNLSRGHRQAIDSRVPFYQGNTGNRELVSRIARDHDIEACIHFAALAYVGESVSAPDLYFNNNVEQGIALLDALRLAGVRSFVFSSSCATYGEPEEIPITEEHPQRPTNPYGLTKLMIEQVLESYDRAYGFSYVALRYFNAAGATKTRGESHAPETHLIPNVLAAAQGNLPFVSVYGDSYPTPDGTAVRDYIHVSDLASAHVLALSYLRRRNASQMINLGNGKGYSVLDVIKSAENVTGKSIETRISPARPGDPSFLVAKADKARDILGWRPIYPKLDVMILSAWEWHLANPEGYHG